MQELLKLLNANEIVAQILSFLILMFILRAFAWKKILGILDKRKERIAKELKDLENSRIDLEMLKKEYLEKINAIEVQAQKKIHDAMQESKVISEEARKLAHLQAQEIIDKAKESIKFELSKAKDDLKKEVIDLTISATENLIREKLTSDQDKRLVNDFLNEVDRL